MRVLPLWVKVVSVAVLIATLVLMGNSIHNAYVERKMLRAAMNEALRRISAEQEKNARQDRILARRDQAHAEIRDNTADVTIRIKEETRNDPPTRALLDTRIPDSVRRAYAQAAAARSAAQRPDNDRANDD